MCKRSSTTARASVCAAIAAALTACGGHDAPTSPPAPSPASVNVVQDSLVLPQQTPGALSVGVADSSGTPLNGVAVTWRSSRPEVVTVNANGTLVTGAPGTAWVSASVGALSDSALVRVAPVWTQLVLSSQRETVCALAKDGSAFCWGNDHSYQIDSLLTDHPAPIRVRGVPAFRQITISGLTVCGLTAEGMAYCWGRGTNGQLGDGTTISRPPPTPAVHAPAPFARLAGGASHVCALTSDGTAWCWGSNAAGQLGVPSTGAQDRRAEPVQVSGGIHFASLSAGTRHTCGIATDGTGYCWGDNAFGKLGLGSGAPASGVSTPTPLAGTLRPASIQAGEEETCALDAAGRAYCWGMAYSGVPDAVAAAPAFTSLSVAGSLVCGVAADARVWCWGENSEGQTGYPAGLFRSQPLPLRDVPPFTSVAAGWHNACAVSAPGAIYCWGSNFSGALGGGDPAVPDANGVTVKVLDPR